MRTEDEVKQEEGKNLKCHSLTFIMKNGCGRERGGRRRIHMQGRKAEERGTDKKIESYIEEEERKSREIRGKAEGRGGEGK